MQPSEKLHQLALRYLTVRGRSCWEMRQYLRRKTDSDEDVDAELERLEQANLINDSVFAEDWVEARVKGRPRSRAQLAQELAAKRIARHIVDHVLETMGRDGELEALLKLASKKLKLPQYRESEKLTAYLLRQGFSYEQVQEALTRLNLR
jgi:regulatory protein